jgi:hypothetical protein
MNKLLSLLLGVSAAAKALMKVDKSFKRGWSPDSSHSLALK